MKQHFDEVRERAEQSPDDWKFGALSEPGIVSVPLAERDLWLPKGETQFTNAGDFINCASQSPCNHLEALFTFHYKHEMKAENKKWFEDFGYVQDGKITFSDRWVSIGSGTTRQGNSLKSPIEFLRKSGLIPKSMLPKEDWMDFDSFHDPSKITQAMWDIGEEFTKRFTINDEQVDRAHFGDVLKDDMVGVAGYAWPKPVNGVYQKTEGGFNHAFLLYKLPKFQVFDSYYDYTATGEQVFGDFTKNLAPDYLFFDWGYRVYISKESTSADWEKDTIASQVLSTLAKFNLLSFFEGFLALFYAPQTPKTAPSSVVEPKPILSPTTAERVVVEAKRWLGKDPTPLNEIPNEVSCVYSLIKIMRPVISLDTKLVSTIELDKSLAASKFFKLTRIPSPGCIIVTPTAGKVRGHCGIFLTSNRIASNDSRTGLWEDNYSLSNWLGYFTGKGLKVTNIYEPL